MSLLACGPYFDEVGAIATIVLLLIVKPLAYFAYIQAFRFRVSRAIPMTLRQAVKLAAARTGLGVFFVGGGAFLLDNYAHGSSGYFGWVYLYLARLVAWWIVGHFGAGLRGRRFVGWMIGGMLINVAFDAAAIGGLVGGWIFPAAAVAVIAVFIRILDTRGRRHRVKYLSSEYPVCGQCEYNLTGNLSGICPECGTPIADAVVSWSDG